MKEKLKKFWEPILDFIKKYKVKIVLICIAIIIFGFIVPLIINSAYEHSALNGIFAVSWEAKDALSFYGTLVGSAATIAGVFLSIKYAQKNYREDIANQIKPFFSLTPYTENRAELKSYIYTPEFNINKKQSSPVAYERQKIDKIYICICENKIRFLSKLNQEQISLIKSGGNIWEHNLKEHSFYLKERKSIFSIPFDIENIGTGTATLLQMSLFKEGTTPEWINLFTFTPSSKLYCHIFTEDFKKNMFGKYYFKLYYEDILKNKYFQTYTLIFKDNPNQQCNDCVFDLIATQEKATDTEIEKYK